MKSFVFFFSFLCLFTAGGVVAQSPTSGASAMARVPQGTFWTGPDDKDVHVDFANKMNSIFQRLEVARVPDGLLLDYAMEFTSVSAYNGVLTDSTDVNMLVLQQIYYTLLMSRIRDTPETEKGFVLPEDFQRIWWENRSKDYIALAGLYFTYSRFAPDAYPAKIDVSADSSQIVDKYVSGEWQDPYQRMKTFAVAPPIQAYQGYTLKVKMPKDLFYSNHSEQIASLEMDFGDGRGYRNVDYDQLIDVRYGGAGTKTWTYKLTLDNGGGVLYARSKIDIL